MCGPYGGDAQQKRSGSLSLSRSLALDNVVDAFIRSEETYAADLFERLTRTCGGGGGGGGRYENPLASVPLFS